jgi:putative MATE family efflux protein
MRESQVHGVEQEPGFWASVWEALRGSQRDFTSGSIPRAVLLLAVPMVLELAGESVFAVADAFFVSRLGAAPLAAVGLTESLMALVYSIAIGLSMATTALVARRWGEGQPKAAGRAAAQAILAGVVISVVLGLVGLWAAPSLLRLMGAAPEVVASGANYTRIMMGGMVTIMLLFLINAAFRGAGDASIAMRSLWLANAVNLILDPCLIFGLGPFPELGLTGAAVATNLGRGAGVVFQLWMLLRRGGRLSSRPADFLPDVPVIRNLMRVSGGGIGQYLVATASWIGLIRILAVFGSNMLAGYVIAIRVIVFAILPAWGLSNAAATLVGQNLGAGRPERAERSVWITGWYNMAFLGAVTVVFLTMARHIVAIFTSDPEIVPNAVNCFRIISYGYVFYAWEMVMVQAFNGAGDTWTPTRLNFACFWLFQIPVAWLLARTLGLGPNGVYWAVALSYSLAAMVAIVLFKRGNWKRAVV